VKQVILILLFVFLGAAVGCFAQTLIKIPVNDCDVPFEFTEKWDIQHITPGSAVQIKEVE